MLQASATASRERWGEQAHDGAGEMPTAKRLEQLLIIILRTIEFDTHGKGKLGDAQLSEPEVKKWIKRRGLQQS